MPSEQILSLSSGRVMGSELSLSGSASLGGTTLHILQPNKA